MKFKAVIAATALLFVFTLKIPVEHISIHHADNKHSLISLDVCGKSHHQISKSPSMPAISESGRIVFYPFIFSTIEDDEHIDTVTVAVLKEVPPPESVVL